MSNYSEEVYKNIAKVSNQDLLPIAHKNFLEYMKNHLYINDEIKVIYDIGSCVLHWSRWATHFWPNAKLFCIDGFDALKEMYNINKINYHLGVLSNKNNEVVNWWENNLLYGGNSIYKEINDQIFNDNNKLSRVSRTLDSVVMEKGWPTPDLIKIDVQGAEMDILKGGLETIANCKYIIMELQEIEYNIGAPLAKQVIEFMRVNGWLLHTPKFSNNLYDADYFFINGRLLLENNKNNYYNNSLFLGGKLNI